MKHWNIYKRILAFTLAVIMLLTIFAANAIRVTIGKDAEEENDETVKYLVYNTEYVNLSPAQRAWALYDRMLQKQEESEQRYYDISVAIAKEDYANALQLIDSYLETIGKNSARYADLMMKKGCLLALTQQETQAMEVFKAILENEPENTYALILQAQMLLQTGDTLGAKEHLGRYLELEEGAAEQLSAMAQLCYASGEYQNALQYGARAVSAYGEGCSDGELFKTMGLSSFMQVDMQQAEIYFDAAIQLITGDAELRYFRGVCRLAMEKFKEALEDFDAAIQNGMEDSNIYYNRGICSLYLDDIQGALADMNKATELNTDPELTQIAQQIIQELS